MCLFLGAFINIPTAHPSNIQTSSATTNILDVKGLQFRRKEVRNFENLTTILRSSRSMAKDHQHFSKCGLAALARAGNKSHLSMRKEKNPSARFRCPITENLLFGVEPF